MKFPVAVLIDFVLVSPSMRREWIEIFLEQYLIAEGVVSLHAEGVD